MITICLLYFRIMVMRIIVIAMLLNFLPLQLIRMTMFMWGVLILLCMWLMIRMFHVIVILLSLFMMLLKFIRREGNMVLCISTILSFSSLCWKFWSCICFAFLCLLLCASMTCCFIRLFFIGSGLDLNVFYTCFLMLSFTSIHISYVRIFSNYQA